MVYYHWHYFRKCLKHYYEIEQMIYSKQGKFIMFLDGDIQLYLNSLVSTLVDIF